MDDDWRSDLLTARACSPRLRAAVISYMTGCIIYQYRPVCGVVRRLRLLCDVMLGPGPIKGFPL